MSTRRQRGNDTVNWAAAWFNENGWSHAEAVGAGRNGKDILGMPGLAPEVKARRALNLTGWLLQAGKVAGVPFVIHRPDGYGREKIARWPVTMRLDDFTRLLREAGYGDREGLV